MLDYSQLVERVIGGVCNLGELQVSNVATHSHIRHLEPTYTHMHTQTYTYALTHMESLCFTSDGTGMSVNSVKRFPENYTYGLHMFTRPTHPRF